MFKTNLIHHRIIVLICTLPFVAACAVVEVGIERPGIVLDAITQTPTLANDTPTAPGMSAATITGVVVQFDPPTGALLLDTEQRARLAEGAVIVLPDGSPGAITDISRGAQLILSGEVQDGVLVASQVKINVFGVRPPDENPVYGSAEGLVTPLPEAAPDTGEVISLFTAASGDTPVAPGAAVTLSWAFTGSEGVICSVPVFPASATCYWDLPPSGSLEVTIDATAVGTAGYTLNVQVPQEGRVASETIKIPLTVPRLCADAWFFANNELLDCPGMAPQPLTVQAQRLEQGMMVRLADSWLGADPLIFVLIGEPESWSGYGNMAIIPDEWAEGMPVNDPTLTPPDGLYQLTHGFGMIWRGELVDRDPMTGEPHHIDWESILGWATGERFEYEAVYQCHLPNGPIVCYLRLPDGEAIGLPSRQ